MAKKKQTEIQAPQHIPLSAAFNPDKNYMWNAEDEFIIKGVDFVNLYNILKEEVQTTTGTAIQNKMVVFNIVQKLFFEGMDRGIVKEQPTT